MYISSKFNVSLCDISPVTGFIPINTWQQRASLPFKPAQGHHLQGKMVLLMFYGDMVKLFQLPFNRLLYHMAVYHKRGNHTETLYEKGLKIRYLLRGSPLG